MSGPDQPNTNTVYCPDCGLGFHRRGLAAHRTKVHTVGREPRTTAGRNLLAVVMRSRRTRLLGRAVIASAIADIEDEARRLVATPTASHDYVDDPNGTDDNDQENTRYCRTHDYHEGPGDPPCPGLAGSEPAGLRERIESLTVYRYILPTDDESTPTRTHRPFDMLKRADVLAALAATPTASPAVSLNRDARKNIAALEARAAWLERRVAEAGGTYDAQELRALRWVLDFITPCDDCGRIGSHDLEVEH